MSNGSNGRIAGSVLQNAGTGAAIGTMLAPGLGTAIGAGAGGLLGGIMTAISEAETSGDMERAARYREQALQIIEQLQAPEAAQLTAQTLGPSALEGVQQNGALSSKIQQLIAQVEGNANVESDPLQQQAYTNAMRGADRQAYNQMQDANAQAARRGISGSGTQLAALLSANERGADAVSNAGMSAASDMYQRRFAALQAALAGNQNERNTALNLSQNKANAADRISQFNASQNWNQQIAQAQQQQLAYQNRAQQAQMRADAMGARSEYAKNDAKRTADGFNSVTQGLASGVAALAPYRKELGMGGSAMAVTNQAGPASSTIDYGVDVPQAESSYAQLMAKKKALEGGY